MKPTITVIGLFIAMVLLAGCTSSYQSKKQRETEKRQEERRKESTKQYQDAVKRHEKMQSKETRKRIRKNKRNAGPQARQQSLLFISLPDFKNQPQPTITDESQIPGIQTA